MWGKGHTYTLLMESQIGVATLESCMEIFGKLGMDPPFDPVIPLLGLYPKDLKSAYYSDTATSMFTAAQFTIAGWWNQPRCPSIDEWIKKLWYMYRMEYYSATKKK